MPELRAFAIQRDDEKWYAGRDATGDPVWTVESDEAHRFPTYVEAKEALQLLQEAGERVRLFGIG